MDLTVTDVPSRMLPVVEGISLAISAHPGSQAERRVVPAGLTLLQTLETQGMGGTGWEICVGGVLVPAAHWGRVRVRPGHLVEIRAKAGKSVLAVAAIIALSVVAGPAGAALAGAIGVTSSVGIALVTGAIMMGGSLVINKLLGPKAVSASSSSTTTETTYALSAGSNSSRLYAPLGLMLGESKVVPDLAAQQYTWFEGEDQYLACTLHAGINCGAVNQLNVGDTLLSTYQGVKVIRAGFPAGNDGEIPSSSVDSISGALLDNAKTDGSAGEFTVRTTSVGTVRIAVDLEFTLSNINNSGAYQQASVELEIAYRPVGSADWMVFYGDGLRSVFQNSSGKPLRRTLTKDVPAGQYEVHLRKVTANATSTQQQNTATWTQLKSYQADTADYSGQPRVLLQVKASGQLTGALNSVNWIARAAGMPLWNGQEWVTVTEPGSAGTSNPGAQILMLMRGIRRPSDGRLMAGLGLPDRKIDIESLKAFMVRSIAMDFRFDGFIQEQMSMSDLLDSIADVGFGRTSRASGKFGVIWLAEDQPIEGVINMARMKAKSFSIDYDMTPTADELEYQFYDAANGYVQSPVRVSDPTLVGTPQRSSTLAVRGTTRAGDAARRARFTLGQSLYAKKSISFELDLEHLVYPRGKVVAISHDLTQWGYSGRLVGFTKTANTFTLQLDKPLRELSSAVRTMGLQLSGEANMRVYNAGAISEDGRTVVINAAWPADVPVPGAARPVRDTVWLFDVKATPGLRARVVSVVPNSKMTGAKVTVVPESREFWNYALNGKWSQPGNDSLLPLTPPSAGNASISAERVRVGEAWRTQLTVVFDVAGNYDHAQVWGSADGAPSELLGETGGTRVSWYADRGQQWVIQVRPFDALGRMGSPATATYTIASNPPANVGGLSLTMTATGVLAAWSAPTGLAAVDWSLTELRRGATWETGTVVFTGRGTNVSLGWLLAGTTTVWAAHKSTAGDWSVPVSASLVVAAPLQPNVTAVRDLSLVSFTWTNSVTSQPLRGYRISEGAAYATSTALGEVTATAYTRNEATPGLHKYWVVAVDVAGNVSAPGSVTIETLPGFEQAKAELTAGLDKTTAVLTGGAELPEPATLLQPLIQWIQGMSQLLTGSSIVKPADLLAVVPVGLIQLSKQQDAINRATLDDLTKTSESLLRVALDAGATNKLVRDAGVYVDKATGTVRIYGVDANAERTNQLQVLLDAVKGQLSLTATTAYVQDAIAGVVAGQADLVLFKGITARVTAVEVTLDSVRGDLLLKASTASVSAAGVRITSAEQRLDAAEGTLASKVSTADFDLANGQLQGRVGTVEQTLATIGDVSSIANTVSQSRSNAKALETDAETTLSDILSGWQGRQKLQEASALATQELRAYTDANLTAQASARLALEASTQAADAKQLAALEQETKVRTEQGAALASQISTLGAQTVTDKADVISRLAVETSLRTSADVATAGQIQTLTAQLSSSTGNLTAQLTAETTARVGADGALTGRIDALTAQYKAADAVIAGQVSSEATTRANAVAALASRVDTVTSQFQAGDNAVVAQVQTEANTRSSADGALSQRIDTLTAQFNNGQSTLGAQLAQESSTRAGETGALTVSTTKLTAESRQNAQQSEASAETQLMDLLNGWRAGQRGMAATAAATQELRAFVDANNAAEASARLKLEAATAAADALQTSALNQETVARTNDVAAVITQIQTLTTQTTTSIGQAISQINTETSQRTAADGALGGRMDSMTAQFKAADSVIAGQVSTEVSTRASAVEALAGRIDTVTSQYQAGDNTLTAQLNSAVSTQASATQAVGTRVDNLLSLVNGNSASVTSSLATLTNAQNAQATRLDGLTATVGGNTASIATQQTVTAGLVNQLAATWSLKVTAGNKIAGMVVNNTGATRDIVLMTDRFAIAAEDNGVVTYPFIVGQVGGMPTGLFDGNVIARGTVMAEALKVIELSAIVAKLGYVTSGRMDLVDDGAGGWGYFRSYPKWLGDGNNGFILGRHANGQTIVELKAGASRLALNSDGDYFELSGPWGYLTNGGLTINQANVINTLNIAGDAVMLPLASAGGNSTAINNIPIPTGARLILIATGTLGSNDGESTLDGSMSISVNGGLVDSTAGLGTGVLTAIHSVGPGTYSVTVTGTNLGNVRLVMLIAKR